MSLTPQATRYRDSAPSEVSEGGGAPDLACLEERICDHIESIDPAIGRVMAESAAETIIRMVTASFRVSPRLQSNLE
jgi:hypothetical protein